MKPTGTLLTERSKAASGPIYRREGRRNLTMGHLGEYLQDLRRRTKLTTRQLGALAGCSASFVTRLEKGDRHPSLDILYQIVQALDGDFDYALSLLLFDSGIPEDRAARNVFEERMEELKLANELRQTGVEEIALRASGLEEAGRKTVLDMIEYIRKAQGLNSKAGSEGSAGEEASHDRQEE